WAFRLSRVWRKLHLFNPALAVELIEPVGTRARQPCARPARQGVGKPQERLVAGTSTGDAEVRPTDARRDDRAEGRSVLVVLSAGSAPRSGGDSRVILGVGHSPGWSSVVTVGASSRSG